MKPAQHGSLLSALARVAPATTPAGFVALAADPAAGRPLIDRLLEEVTVKETSFFRDLRQLESIDWHRVLRSAHARGDAKLRAWSAGCATGEEPYSLALLACEAFASTSPPVEILGTDVARSALETAVAARYRARALRELDDERRARWFRREGDSFVVDERLRALVSFERHNLAADASPPPGRPRFDLVLCRNVLIYFGPPTVERVLAGLEGALQPGGTLLIGAADALCGAALGPRPAPADVPAAPAARRRPLGRSRRDAMLADALRAADAGRSEEAGAHVSRLLADNPLDADAYFLRGLIELQSGHAGAAAVSLRRALSIDPRFGLAAFQLGRASDALGDDAAAVQAYRRALGTLEPDDERHELLLQQVDLGDVAAACRTRLAPTTVN